MAEMTEENKRVVRRFVEEVCNCGEIRAIPDLIASEHVSHLPMGDHYGQEGVRIDISSLRAAFPDLQVTIEDMVAEGDEVFLRFTTRGTHQGPFMGVLPTGREVSFSGVAIHRLRQGKSTERWVVYDGIDLLQQLGIDPGLARAAD
jgi:steroid delta-isomerase-like uncharacterized protein